MKKLKRQRGAALVEFAIVVPLLLTLVFGMIEFGVLLYDQQVITNASREGARAGIVAQTPRLDTTQIEGIVKNYAATHLVTFGTKTVNDLKVTSTYGSQTFPNPLTVNVTYDYSFLVIPNFIPGINKLKTLSATTVMRYE